MRAAIAWAAGFSLRGPAWIPRAVRRLPLVALVRVAWALVLLGALS